MKVCVYDKTEKGREEIATRKYALPSRLRTLLVMVDGHATLEAVLKNVAGLGLDGESVSLLLKQGYIQLISGGEEAACLEAAAPRKAIKRRTGTAAFLA
ncbi:MAG: hypothetical protein V4463_04975 [Pseudomonadota bacterium]